MRLIIFLWYVVDIQSGYRTNLADIHFYNGVIMGILTCSRSRLFGSRILVPVHRHAVFMGSEHTRGYRALKDELLVGAHKYRIGIGHWFNGKVYFLLSQV